MAEDGAFKWASLFLNSHLNYYICAKFISLRIQSSVTYKLWILYLLHNERFSVKLKWLVHLCRYCMVLGFRLKQITNLHEHTVGYKNSGHIYRGNSHRVRVCSDLMGGTFTKRQQLSGANRILKLI